MILAKVFEQFVKESPVTVMFRGAMENIFLRPLDWMPCSPRRPTVSTKASCCFPRLPICWRASFVATTNRYWPPTAPRLKSAFP